MELKGSYERGWGGNGEQKGKLFFFLFLSHTVLQSAPKLSSFWSQLEYQTLLLVLLVILGNSSEESVDT